MCLTAGFHESSGSEFQTVGLVTKKHRAAVNTWTVKQTVDDVWQIVDAGDWELQTQVHSIVSEIYLEPAARCWRQKVDRQRVYRTHWTSETWALVDTQLSNTILSHMGKFRDSQKSAIIRPLMNMDPSDLNSYRPISNLSFVSKHLERIIDSRFTEHANTTPITSWKHHPTETALIKNPHRHLHQYRPTSCRSPCAILDLSSASDTVDHNLLWNLYKISRTIRWQVLAKTDVFQYGVRSPPEFKSWILVTWFSLLSF